MKIALLGFVLFISGASFAQKKTILRTNILGLPLRSYNIELERTLTRKFSIGASYRNMPVGPVPQVEQIIRQSEITDVDLQNALRSSKFGSTALTLEARLYLSKKGYGRGFYMGGWYRSTNFKLDALSINVVDGTTNRNITANGKFDIKGGGLLMGMQFAIAKKLTLDLQMLGVGAGNATLNLSANPSPALTASEQTDVRTTLDGIDVPGVTVTSNVTANNVTTKGTGTMPWLRAAISFGIRL